MSTAAKLTRENRTITVDFRDEATYVQLLGDGKAFVECVCAFLLALGFPLAHKATCQGGGYLTRHSHYLRVRLGGVTIWRIQCTRCRAVFTVLPHFVLRYRQSDQRWPATPCWPPMGGSVWSGVRSSGISPPAQFLLDCSSSKWSKHVTNSPFLARLATAGSSAAYKIISVCSNAVR